VAYKSRNFDQAISHYQKAWELYKDITYLNNLSAAYFEKGDYETSIKEAQKAVEEGREIHSDFKLIAKYDASPRVNYINCVQSFRTNWY
jgi:stress-induced-phosphoprotein 1